MSTLRFPFYLWTLPNTLLGLFVITLCLPFGTRVRIESGVIEAHGRAVQFLLSRVVPLKGGAMAITIGHVVLGVSQAALDVTRSHERVHVRQYERWGPLFIPAYFAASGLAWMRGEQAYRGNAFEKEAYEKG